MKRFAKVLITLSLATGAVGAIAHVDPITESPGSRTASAQTRVDPITETILAAGYAKVDPITESVVAAGDKVDPITE